MKTPYVHGYEENNNLLIFFISHDVYYNKMCT